FIRVTRGARVCQARDRTNEVCLVLIRENGGAVITQPIWGHVIEIREVSAEPGGAFAIRTPAEHQLLFTNALRIVPRVRVLYYTVSPAVSDSHCFLKARKILLMYGGGTSARSSRAPAKTPGAVATASSRASSRAARGSGPD